MATLQNDTKGTHCLAVWDQDATLKKHEIGRPAPGPKDVSIEIKYCGMCHSDLHATNGDWSMPWSPLTPGHEISGIVQGVGTDVTSFKVGDRVGVGCFIDSCMDCDLCKSGDHNYCDGLLQTYGSQYPEGKGHDDCVGHTNGGYSSQITVLQDFVYVVPEELPLEASGPLLCAGITTFGPLNRHILQKGGGKGKKVGIVGFGGLGHMATKLAKAMGCEVTLLSRDESKKDEAKDLGAGILAHTDAGALKAASKSFHLIIDTVSAPHDIAGILGTVRPKGTYCCLGAIPKPFELSAFALIMGNLSIEGSLVGGIPETQAMIDFCAEHKVLPEYKVIAAKDAAAQFKAMANGTAGADRAVIDMGTLDDIM